MHKNRPGWVPSLSRDGGALPAGRPSPAGTRRLLWRPVLYPAKTSHLAGVALTRHHRGFTCFTRPAFPSPVAPGWSGDPWASPWASDPAVAHDARQDRDKPLSTGSELHPQHRLTLQSDEFTCAMRPRVAQGAWRRRCREALRAPLDLRASAAPSGRACGQAGGLPVGVRSAPEPQPGGWPPVKIVE
jgi:hypothetical protein